MSKIEALVEVWNENNDASDFIVIPRAAAESIRNTLAAGYTQERAVWIVGSLFTYFDAVLQSQPQR